MKTLSALILIAGSLIIVAAAWIDGAQGKETSIQFMKGSWEEVTKKAKEENKLIFIDVYATWCGPCKLLKKTTFSDKEVGEFFNSRFVNAAFDGETDEGQMIMQRYNIRSYPTMFFVSADGTIKEAVVGYHTAHQLLRAGKKVLN